eukprot:jgi/Mesvir1/19790/Mv25382-RA.1
MEFLAQFSPFKLQYVKGVDNIVPDALSRRADYSFFEDLDVLNTTLVPTTMGVTPYGELPDEESYAYLFHTAVRMPDLLSHVGLSLPCEALPVVSVGGEGKNKISIPLSHIATRSGKSYDNIVPLGPPLLFGKAVGDLFKPVLDTSVAMPTSDLERLISRFTATEPEALAAIAAHPQQLGKHPCKFVGGFLYVQIADSPPQWRLYVPPICRSSLLFELHDLAAHQGGKRVRDLVARSYYWPSLLKDVDEYVRTCQSCQEMKPNNVGQIAEPRTLPDPIMPWDSIMMDFVGPFRKNDRGNAQILVFVDRFTRMCHLVPCPLELTARDCARLYLNNVYRYHGLSRQFISDKDKLFTSDFWQQFFAAIGTKVTFGTAYHSSSSHLVERLNRVVEEALRHYVNCSGSDWEDYLCLVEFSLNNCPQAAHGYTPFFLDTGRQPLTPTSLLASPLRDRDDVSRDTVEGVQALLDKMKNAHDHAISGYHKAQSKYLARLRASLDRRAPEIDIGDLVLVEGPRVGRFAHKFEAELKVKLRPAFLGPFRVLSRVGNFLYKIDIPTSWQTHSNTFHRSQLKLYHQSTFAGRELAPAPLEHNPDTGEVEDEVESIVAHRDIKKGRGTQRQYKVKWMYARGEVDKVWYTESDLDGCSRLLQDYKTLHQL